MNADNLLDTSYRHLFVYTSDYITIEILGGIRVDILDRTRIHILEYSPRLAESSSVTSHCAYSQI